MTNVPSGTELPRPFVPARDFESSKRFYLDSWWTRITSLNLESDFHVPAPRPPAMQPWGLRVAYVTDPARVLWHVAQRRAGVPQDL